MRDGDEAKDLSPEREARRHLLKLAAYVPPAILGVMIAGPGVALAAQVGTTEHCGGGSVIVVSASGQACCPCVPSSTQYDINRCNLERCQLGNCSACTQVIFHNRNACEKATASCGCTCRQVQMGEDKHSVFWMCR